MSGTLPEYHDSRNRIANHDLGSILLVGVGAVLLPLSITVVVSYPVLGVGILAGAVLPRLPRAARRLDRRVSRSDGNTGSRPVGR